MTIHPATVKNAFTVLESRFFSPRAIAAAMYPLAGRHPGEPEVNVVGIGIGEKQKQGISLGVPCVRIYVRKKLPLEDLRETLILPMIVGEVPTDVVEVGTIKAMPTTSNPCTKKRMGHQPRPVPGGISVGHVNITVGTLGVRVRDDAAWYILSNNHVLADENRASVGDLVLQPGPDDGGDAADPTHHIALLSRFVRLHYDGATNFVDAAIARIDQNDVEAAICSIGAPVGVRAARRNLVVHKHGRTTGYTVGRVTDVNATIWVEYDAGSALFKNQITIQGGTASFSKGGDSGSLILDMQLRACGLLFAGSESENFTWANPLKRVFSSLKVELG